MVRYNISDLKIADKGTLSKGNQAKYTLDHKWVKVDALGYESLVEVLASQVCAQLSIPHVEYKLCQVCDAYQKRNACVSEDFAGDLVEVSLGSLLYQKLGRHADLEKFKSITERVDAVYDPIANLIDRNEFNSYLNRLLSLDRVLYNEDRHLFNICFLYDGARLTPAPIFDCGAGLLSDLQIDYPLNMPIKVCWQHVKAKPFSRSFTKQTAFFNSICGNPFTSTTIEVDLTEAEQLYSHKVISRALQTLCRGLAFYDIKLANEVSSTTIYFSS